MSLRSLALDPGNRVLNEFGDPGASLEQPWTSSHALAALMLHPIVGNIAGVEAARVVLPELQLITARRRAQNADILVI